MKKVITLMVSLAFLFSVAVAPVWAGGDKNQNEHQQDNATGDVAGEAAPGPGDDANENQSEGD